MPKVDQEPFRFDRIGSQEVVTKRLLDELPNAKIESIRLEKPGFQVVRSGKRSYSNPWAGPGSRGLDHRTVWTDGRRHQWALRSSLALPVPTKITWTIKVPPGSMLRFDTATGSRVTASEPVNLEVSVQPTGKSKATRLWSERVVPKPIHKLKRWSAQEIDLSAYAGREVALTLSARTDTQTRGYRYTSFFYEPSIVTRVTDEATRAASTQATGMDVMDNVLLIVVDAQRADSIGDPRKRLPRLFPAMESLVDDGMHFARASSVGNQTRLSTFAMLSSQYPTYGKFHKVRWNYSNAEKAAFYDGDPPLLPRVLRGLGYRSIGVANNLFVFGNLKLSLDASFDEFIDHRHNTKDTAWITETATSWIQKHYKERWFMMLNYNAPHLPYQPPKRSYDAFEPKLAGVSGYSNPYLGEVKWVDENIAEILTLLDELDISGRTLVILTSDHGEVMDPRHDCWNKNWRSRCLHQHGKTLFEEELHVPLVMRLPGRIPAGPVVQTRASHIDLVPTVLGLLGVSPTADQLGRDLSQAVLTGTEPESAPVMAEARLSTALISGDYKYIIHDTRERMEFNLKTLFDEKRSLDELYNLENDPDELMNLAWDVDQSPRLAMRAQLAELRADLARRRGLPIPEWSPTPTLERRPAEGETSTERAAPPEEVVGAVGPVVAEGDPVVEAGREVTAKKKPTVGSTMIFHGGGPPHAHFTGRIHTTDRFVQFEVLEPGPGNNSRLEDEGTIEVDMNVEAGRAGFRFRTESDDAELTFLLRIDDKPLGAARFYVGAYGLKLFKNPLGVSSPADYRMAHAPDGGPSFIKDIKPGVFYWRDGLSATVTKPKSDGDIESEDAIDGEVRNLMKDWGYTNH